MALLPDGRVLNYGTGETAQGRNLMTSGSRLEMQRAYYSANTTSWTSSAARRALGQVLRIGAGLGGKLLITGGNLCISGVKLLEHKVNVFNPGNNR
jgi:hypothetical protein